MKKSPLHPPTDLDIQALVDNQLDWEDEKQVWAGISKDPALYRRYQEILEQKKLLLAWWKSEKSLRPQKTNGEEKSEHCVGKFS